MSGEHTGPARRIDSLRAKVQELEAKLEAKEDGMVSVPFMTHAQLIAQIEREKAGKGKK